MHHIYAALLAAGACASIAHAQAGAPSSAILTLEDALSAAGAKAPAVAAASANERAAAAQRAVARLRPNPTLDVMSENIAGTGMFSGLQSAETTVSLALPLELGGKRSARIGVADAQIARAAITSAMTEADLRLRVTRAYNDAVAAQRRAAHAREQAGIAAESLRAARARVASGRASPLEEQRADVARINADGALERADRSAAVARDTLARLIGRPVDALDDQWFAAIASTGPRRPVEASGTLAVAAARADLASATAQVRLAQSQRIPDLTVSAGARRLEASNDTAAVVGLSIPLPLRNAGRSGIAVATAQREQADAMRRAAQIDAEQDIATAEADAANAATTARIANGPALAAAREAARIARIGYREGKFGQLDLLEAERTLAETRIAAIDALQTYHEAQARLERLTTPAPDFTRNAQ